MSGLSELIKAAGSSIIVGLCSELLLSLKPPHPLYPKVRT